MKNTGVGLVDTNGQKMNKMDKNDFENFSKHSFFKVLIFSNIKCFKTNTIDSKNTSNLHLYQTFFHFHS